MKDGRRLSFFAAAGALLAFLGYAIYIGTVTSDVRIQAVALGVVGSLIASLVFATLSEWTDSPQTRAQARLDGAADRVEGLWQREDARVREGVLGVVEKREHDPDYWFGVLKVANDRLDLVGHSLSGWLHGAYREELRANVGRVLQAGGRVRVLVMDPRGRPVGDLSNLLERDYPGRVTDFLALMREISTEPRDRRSQGRLEVRLARDDLAYMMIDNGAELHVSPYMAVTRATRPMVLRVAASSRFADDYRTDFTKLFDRGQPTEFASTHP